MKKEINDLQNEIADLKSQLASIKYLNADEVEKILEIMQDDARAERLGYFKRTVNAICNLAIDIDRDKIIEVLRTQLKRWPIPWDKIESVSEIYATFLKETDFLADEIIKAIRKD